MSQIIEAIYENGVFKPLRPVTLPEGTRADVKPSLTTDQLEELLRQEMLAKGVDPDQLEKILANLRLAWAAFDSLTPEEEQGLAEARLDQVNFFKHRSSA